MSATASHLVEFYQYCLIPETIGKQAVMSLYDSDMNYAMSSSNLQNPFDNTLFVGYEEGKLRFQITQIII
jgi:hypothetical protein